MMSTLCGTILEEKVEVVNVKKDSVPVGADIISDEDHLPPALREMVLQ